MVNKLIHKYKLNEHNIVLDVNSGGVHIVSDVAYDILDIVKPPFDDEALKNAVDVLSNYSNEEVTESFNELKQLYEDGVLYSVDDYEKYANMMVASPIKSMCLHVAHDCNLRCKYCFASTGDFGGGRALMDADTGKAAIDFLIKYSVGRKNIELDFFGGEPLMNFDVVKEVVEYARGKEKEHNKNFRFTITTNGVLLNDEITDYINKEMSNVVLSIDGRKEVNDNLRPTCNQKGSYDVIMPKFIDLVKKRNNENYYVRGTFTKHNLDFTNDVIHLNDMGFDQISVEPVVADPKMDYALTDSDIELIKAEYEKLALEVIDRKNKGLDINFFHFMIDLDQGPCAIKRLRGCGCGNEYVAVTPDGDIYPCHQFVGMEEWKMGSLSDLSIDFNKKDYFAKATVYNKKDCTECWAKFYCSGGCNANNLVYAGDVHNAHKFSCELEKKRVECAIMLKAELAE